MYTRKLFVVSAFLLTVTLGIPMGEVPTLTKYQNHYSYNYTTSAKLEWKCVNNICEEVVTKCKNGVCETKKKNQIDAQIFKPEVLQLDPPPFDVTKFDSSVQQSWRCVNNDCEELVTTCKNGLCNTKTTKFNGQNFRPDVQNVIPSSGTAVDNTRPIDSSVVDYKNFFWSNSKKITKNCENRICTTVTKTCTNGTCQEDVATSVL